MKQNFLTEAQLTECISIIPLANRYLEYCGYCATSHEGLFQTRRQENGLLLYKTS